MSKQITNSDIFRAINDFRDEAKDCFISKDRYNAEIPPIKDAISKVTWLVVSSVVIAVLALVIKTTDLLAMMIIR